LAVDAAPALLGIAGKSVGGNYHAKRTFHYQARRALTRLATAIGLDADDTRINTIMGADHEDGTTELRHADLALRVVPRGFLPGSEVSISRCRDGQEIGRPHRAPITELLDVAAFQHRLAGIPGDIGAARFAAAA
jgi:hypothetical protein